MKKLFQILIWLAPLVLVAACNKSIDDNTEDVAALAPAATDAEAGTWKPVLLSAPDEIAVAEPLAASTPAYTAELNEIKSWQQHLTTTQKAAIKYWSAGAVLRWNEIMRELVARHNIPPYQNADG